MYDWRVGLREREGKWFSTGISEDGRPVISGRIGFDTPGESVDQLQKELEDWHAYVRARFPL